MFKDFKSKRFKRTIAVFTLMIVVASSMKVHAEVQYPDMDVDGDIKPVYQERKVERVKPKGGATPAEIYYQKQGLMREKQIEQSNADEIAVKEISPESKTGKEIMESVKSSATSKTSGINTIIPIAVVAIIIGTVVTVISIRKEKEKKEERMGLY